MLQYKLNMRTILFLIAAIFFLMAGSAFAAATPPSSFDAWADHWDISELKAGFLKHDVDNLVDITSHRQEKGFDLNGEILFDSPRFLSWMGAPRPNIGATINTHGDTSHGYIGLQWMYQFDFGLFADVNGGFAAHTGLVDNYKLDENHELEKRLGSRILFHFAPEIGYRFSNGYGVSLYWEHLSNGQVLTDGDTNEGLDNAGVRLSYLINAGK